MNFGVAGDLYINIGSEFKVVLEGEKSLLDEIETEVSGSKLVIKNENWHFHGNEKVTVYITMPELSGLGVSGSGKAEIKDAIKAENLDFSVSGSGKIITGDLALGKLNVGISGSGDVIIGGSGEAKSADVSISGSGNYSGETLKIAVLISVSREAEAANAMLLIILKPVFLAAALSPISAVLKLMPGYPVQGESNQNSLFPYYFYCTIRAQFNDRGSGIFSPVILAVLYNIISRINNILFNFAVILG